MKYQLRPYQEEAVNQAMYGLTKYKKPFVIQAATGAGKSLIIAEICHRLDVPVLILQPSKEILEQNYQKLLSYDPMIDAGIYSASKKRKEICKFTFATIGSIYKKPEEFAHFQYVIIDECHGVDPKNIEGMLTSFLKAINVTAVCGLTATPYRIASKYYTDEWGGLFYTAHLKMINRIAPFFFKRILYKIETADLIEQGFLSPIQYYADNVDTSELKVNSTGRDFTDESMEKFWNDKRLRRIAEAVEYADGHHKKSLIFCSSLRQAGNALKLVTDMGFNAAMVSGTTPMKERERIIEEYRAGNIKHLFNVGVFTTGFDVPELDCIILARTTMSLALYYQMVGRGVRLDPQDPNKVLAVYDLSGVVGRLGRVESIRVKTEEGGFRDEVWSEAGRMDEEPLFNWFVKNRPKHLEGKNEKN
jgi:DNA repair protein RadD